jgi:hypothetical protein
VDEEQKPDDSAERLSASAFLARYGSFRYIETRSAMNMSDKGPAFASGLPRVFLRNGVRREQDSRLAPLQELSNRERQLLEPPLTHRKQTVAPRSNRELSTNQCSCNFHWSGALLSNGLPRQMQFLTGSAPQTEIDVTCSKQTTEKFLTGARTHIKEIRICAKMSAQISSKLSAQMSQIR